MTKVITRSEDHPWYWEYDGEPTILLGGSDTDNLFQWAGGYLKDHLDRLVEVGGNYVRNTLSDRGPNDAYAFATVRDGVYDLDRWNETYWRRLERFLDATAERNIIVQLTLWDQHDFGGSLWENHPWNPHCNVNYGRYESGLSDRDALFSAVDRNPVVYPYLRRFIDRVLDISLQYDHVLYNVNNESTVGEAWERHWAEYVRERAADLGTDVYVTSMNMWAGQSVSNALRHPDLYEYIDISQVNQTSKGFEGEPHWEAVQAWRAEVEDELGPRPLTNVKIYGTDEENLSTGSAQEAIARFWRNLLGGCSSVRFHRPTHWGIGLSDRARAQIQSARRVTEMVDLVDAEPRNDLLSDRTTNEAYCAARPGREYVVYFPDGGEVTLDLSIESESAEGRLYWLDTEKSERYDETTVHAGSLSLAPPSDGNWVAIISAV